MNLLNPSRRAALVTPLLMSLALAPIWVPMLLPTPSLAATTGSGKSVSETRTVSEFQAISLGGSMDLVVRQGAQPSVQVQADDNVVSLLETVVEGGGDKGPTLQVRWKKGENLRLRSKVLVTVVTPKLTALTAAGSGDIKLETFSTPTLQLALSGSGDARLDSLTTEELGIRIAGSGDVTGKGSAGKLKVSIAGSGDVRLSDFRSDEVTVAIAGSGDAAVNAQKTLSVSIAGSGDVTYTGNATVKSSVAGSGSVTRK